MNTTTDFKISFEEVDQFDGKSIWIGSLTILPNSQVASAFLVECPSFVRITHLFVNPESRQKGWGNRFLQGILKRCDELKRDSYIESDSFRVPGEKEIIPDKDLRKWYHGMGFVNVLGHPFAMVRHPATNLPNP